MSASVDVALEIAVPAKQYSIKVRKRPEERLVTVIELVSPADKRKGSADRRRYLRKRDTYLPSDKHFLEIDLIRRGERWPAGREPAAAYRVLLSRAGRRPHAQVWPIGLRDALPTVAVPLLEEDPDVALDLQAVFLRAYDGAGYDRVVRYQEPLPPPPLSDDDLVWAKDRVGTRRAD